MNEISSPAWLEVSGGHKVPIGHACSIGRSRSNQLVLDDTRVSRQHAVIQSQGDGRFMVVDFGSANGTRVNGRRVVFPTELKDGSEVEIGGLRFLFRREDPVAVSVLDRTTTTLTVREVRRLSCWLLVVDIVDSTQLYRSLPAEELSRVVGQWFVENRGLLEASGGVITQYTGDGFFAHWPDAPASDGKVLEAVRELARRQGAGPLAFRWVLHLGEVSVAGSLQPGEESLMGPEVHFVFRMESIAKAVSRGALLSEAVVRRLGDRATFRVVGSYGLKGFDGRYTFYEF